MSETLIYTGQLDGEAYASTTISMKSSSQICSLVVVGCSAGGLEALSSFLSGLDPEMRASVVIVQHLSPSGANYLARHLTKRTRLPVEEAADKMFMEAGHVYVAPPDYHLLVEKEHTFSLSLEGRVNFARPSIDVLFESAAQAFGAAVVGVILTGANRDGRMGCQRIREKGGIVLVQDPETAEYRTMPEAAISGSVDGIMAIGDLVEEVNRLTSAEADGRQER